MSNIIAATIAILMALAFFLIYAIRLNSIPLWIIFGANMCFLLYDYFKAVTEGEDHI